MPRKIVRDNPTSAMGRNTVTTTPNLRRLTTLNTLQPTERVLRLGWIVIAGTVTFRGKKTQVCLPLISQPVRLRRRVGALSVKPLATPELTPLVADPDVAARLEADATYGGGFFDLLGHEPTAAEVGSLGRLRTWITRVVAAAGLPPVAAVLPPADDPAAHRDTARLVACVGSVVYLATDPLRPSLEGSLRAWAEIDGLDRTAFAALYASAAPPVAGGNGAADEPVVNPLRLSAAQRSAVVRARHAPVAVVSGPPGTGKSHTVAAIAADAVAAGRSVLIATRSSHAADAIAP